MARDGYIRRRDSCLHPAPLPPRSNAAWALLEPAHTSGHRRGWTTNRVYLGINASCFHLTRHAARTRSGGLQSRGILSHADRLTPVGWDSLCQQPLLPRRLLPLIMTYATCTRQQVRGLRTPLLQHLAAFYLCCNVCAPLSAHLTRPLFCRKRQ